MAESDDTWNPFDDPEGDSALKQLENTLTPDEKRILRGLAKGATLREVEIDRLVARRLAERDLKTGAPSLSELGRNVVRSIGRD